MDYLSDRLQQVVLDNQHSDLSNVISGVSQGAALAPLLFSSNLYQQMLCATAC